MTTKTKYRTPKTLEVRWTVQAEYYNDAWQDYATDTYPILYATETEAAARIPALQSGAEHWHDEDGVTFRVVQIAL